MTATSTAADIKLPQRRLMPPMLFAILICSLLLWGYLDSDDVTLSAETGFGYILGIAGLSCMLLLLTYPLAKHQPFMRRVLSLKHWFRLHMVLGILGPVAILFHCNFQHGSLNSSVALYCMLLVVGSGLIGRYLYSKVHLGLYGNKATSAELLTMAQQQKQRLLDGFRSFPQQKKQIDTLYDKLLPKDYTRVSLSLALLAAPRRAWQYWLIGRTIREQNDAELNIVWQESRRTLRQYLDILRKLAQLSFFERLLSWWHVLHLPIFFMMLITAGIHVWAVHRY